MYVCVKHKSIQTVTSLLASDHHIWNNCPSVSSPWQPVVDKLSS